MRLDDAAPAIFFKGRKDVIIAPFLDTTYRYIPLRASQHFLSSAGMPQPIESVNHVVELCVSGPREHGQIWTSMDLNFKKVKTTSTETMNSQQIDIVEHRFLLLDCHRCCSCNIPQSGCWTPVGFQHLPTGSQHQSHLRAAANTQ